MRMFNGRYLVDIREYYTDDAGERKPGRKGGLAYSDRRTSVSLYLCTQCLSNVYLTSFYVGVLPGLPPCKVIEGLGTRLGLAYSDRRTSVSLYLW